MKRTFGLISLMTIVILLLNMLSPVMAMSFSTIYERQTIQIVPENVLIVKANWYLTLKLRILDI